MIQRCFGAQLQILQDKHKNTAPFYDFTKRAASILNATLEKQEEIAQGQQHRLEAFLLRAEGYHVTTSHFLS